MNLSVFATPQQNNQSTNRPKIFFTDYCEVCKAEGVFLLDNKCSDCLEDLINPFAKQKRELSKSITVIETKKEGGQESTALHDLINTVNRMAVERNNLEDSSNISYTEQFFNPDSFLRPNPNIKAPPLIKTLE